MSTDRSTLARMDSTYAGTQKLLIDVSDVVGHKWHPVILHQLLAGESMGFSDLKSSIDGISGKMLSDSLTTLEERDLVAREVVNDKPVRVSYSLTDRGRDFGDVVAAMVSWGDEHLEGARGPIAGLGPDGDSPTVGRNLGRVPGTEGSDE